MDKLSDLRKLHINFQSHKKEGNVEKKKHMIKYFSKMQNGQTWLHAMFTKKKLQFIRCKCLKLPETQTYKMFEKIKSL